MVAVAFLMLAAAPPVAAANETPDLSGTWILNEDESDNPRERFSRGGGMRLGGGSGGGGMRPGGGRGGGGMRPGDRQGTMGDPSRFREMTITQEGARLVFRYADDRERIFYPDGRAEGESGAPVLATAEWKKSKLRIERESQRGTLIETFELQPEGARLIVTTKMKSGGRSMSFKRVYDRAEVASAETAAELGI